MAITITGDVGTAVTAFGVLAGVLGNLYLQFRTLKVQAAQGVKIETNTALTEATAKVAQVAADNSQIAVDNSQAAIDVSTKTNEKVEQVHLATNSLTDRLVALTKREAYNAGAKDEKDRAAGLTPSDRPPLTILPASENEQAKEGVKP